MFVISLLVTLMFHFCPDDEIRSFFNENFYDISENLSKSQITTIPMITFVLCFLSYKLIHGIKRRNKSAVAPMTLFHLIVAFLSLVFSILFSLISWFIAFGLILSLVSGYHCVVLSSIYKKFKDEIGSGLPPPFQYEIEQEKCSIV